MLDRDMDSQGSFPPPPTSVAWQRPQMSCPDPTPGRWATLNHLNCVSVASWRKQNREWVSVLQGLSAFFFFFGKKKKKVLRLPQTLLDVCIYKLNLSFKSTEVPSSEVNYLSLCLCAWNSTTHLVGAWHWFVNVSTPWSLFQLVAPGGTLDSSISPSC